MRASTIYKHLEQLYPKAHCELVHSDPYQLTVAVMLSAQTTDAAVNRVTPALFAQYADINALAAADLNALTELIRTIGLYRNKARNLIGLAQLVQTEYHGVIPQEREALMRLPGIGRKSANVIVAECFNEPAIAVDTHVERVAKRLGLADTDDSVLVVEQKLMQAFPRRQWRRLHHLMIFFGRYRCKAKQPACAGCPFIKICCYQAKARK